jgi:hypothetical protein
MRSCVNIAAACIAIVAIMYLFVLPAVNPPVSTGAQWLSAHAPLPTYSAAMAVHVQSPATHLYVQESSDALPDILDLDSVRRC